MDSKVRVTADPVGNVVVPSKNNSAYGHIRVEQDRVVVDDRGFARKKTISALIMGLLDDLKSFNWTKDSEIEGSIIFREQLQPFNTVDPDRDYKIAGKTGIVCCIDGQPIYRKTFYSQKASAEDLSLAHNNGEAIKAAYAELKDIQDETAPAAQASIGNL